MLRTLRLIFHFKRRVRRGTRKEYEFKVKHLNEKENLHKLHFPHRMFLNGWVLGFFIWNEQAEAFTYIQIRFFPFYIDLELSEIVF